MFLKLDDFRTVNLANCCSFEIHEAGKYSEKWSICVCFSEEIKYSIYFSSKEEAKYIFKHTHYGLLDKLVYFSIPDFQELFHKKSTAGCQLGNEANDE